MHIAIIGASGFIGSGLLKEALSRGHQVKALVGRPERLAPHPQMSAVKADVMDTSKLTAELAGQEAVLSAFSGHAQEDVYGYYMRGIRSIIAATKAAQVPRFLVIGGAGSLEVAPGVQLLDTPEFPAQWKGTAQGAREALALLRQESSLDWTMLCPAAVISPGQRTGKFRLGGDQLLSDAAGKSAISVEDFAVAMIDELETPKHRRARFTVAY